MLPYFFNGRPQGWIVANHPYEEVFEVIREVLASGLLPVLLVFAFEKELVEVVIGGGIIKWENSIR